MLSGASVRIHTRLEASGQTARLLDLRRRRTHTTIGNRGKRIRIVGPLRLNRLNPSISHEVGLGGCDNQRRLTGADDGIEHRDRRNNLIRGLDLAGSLTVLVGSRRRFVFQELRVVRRRESGHLCVEAENTKQANDYETGVIFRTSNCPVYTTPFTSTETLDG